MEAQAAQIQKKLQVELDNFKATQKGESQWNAHENSRLGYQHQMFSLI